MNAQLVDCLQLKDACVETRLEKHEVVLDLMEKTKAFKGKENEDAKEIMMKREQVLQLD